MVHTDGRQTQKTTFASALRPLAGPLLIFLLAVYFYALAGKIDEAPPEQLGAAFWPRMILILLMVSCGIKALEIIREGKREEAVQPQEVARPPEANVPKLAAMIAMIIAVVYFMDVLGFALANFLFLLIFMRIAGLRKRLTLLLISTGGTVFLLYLFVKVVYLPLPKGQWVFDDLTIMLYRFLHII